MSKVVFLGFPGHGHINPSMGVVKELISRGEKVFYFATPEYKPKITSTGAEFCNYRISMNKRANFTKKVLRKKINFDALNQIGKEAFNRMDFYLKIMENRRLNLKKAIMKIAPDYIIHDACANWGKTLSKQLGIPAISSVVTFAYCDKILETHPEFVLRNILLAPDRLMSHPQEAQKIFQMLSNKIGTLFNVPDYDFFDIAYSHEALNIIYTSKEFQYFNEFFDSGFKFVGPSISRKKDSSFPWDRLTGEKLIYISLGTVHVDNFAYEEFFQKCFAAFGNLGNQVVLNIGNINSRKLGTIPENFIVRNFVPQLDILERATLFVTHGGMNSANEALYFNVPMIVIPQRVDQFLVAGRVAELGAGINLKNMEFTAQELSDAALK
ncbi:MAG TPA: macrolide family glycosyltransferase, partial [Bacillota bacterium]|nr:macrolide family glycosyltransferase [Bacillota bacterium]